MQWHAIAEHGIVCASDIQRFHTSNEMKQSIIINPPGRALV
jgi:hypothetical protein